MNKPNECTLKPTDVATIVRNNNHAVNALLAPVSSRFRSNYPWAYMKVRLSLAKVLTEQSTSLLNGIFSEKDASFGPANLAETWLEGAPGLDIREGS